jgi:hypothetical protein
MSFPYGANLAPTFGFQIRLPSSSTAAMTSSVVSAVGFDRAMSRPAQATALKHNHPTPFSCSRPRTGPSGQSRLRALNPSNYCLIGMRFKASRILTRTSVASVIRRAILRTCSALCEVAPASAPPSI